MGKKDNEKKEKTLEQMTAKELRELALAEGSVVGVHAMNKDELIDAIREAKGITVARARHSRVDVRALKGKIKELKTRKVEAAEGGNNKLLDSLRRRISNLKKKTRRKA
jgi:sulfite reductase alpha subunit-like flavoprotein